MNSLSVMPRLSGQVAAPHPTIGPQAHGASAAEGPAATPAPSVAEQRAQDERPRSEGKGVRVHYDESAARYVFEIIDGTTDQVIEQIPPQALLDVAAQLESLRGLLFDGKS
jgi:hypothetical protein